MRGTRRKRSPVSSWRAVWSFVFVGLSLLFVARASAQELDHEAPRDMPDLSATSESSLVPPLPSDFETRETDWLRLAFPSSSKARIDSLLRAANEAREDLAQELGRPVLHFVEVRIARDPEEMNALAPVGMPPPEYAEGVAYAKARLVIISLVAPNAADPPVLSEVLKHELAHVALFDAVGGYRVPRWFNEGFAVHASGESTLVRTRTLWLATLSKRLLPMSDLDRSFPAHSNLASVAYAQSADFVRFLLRRQDRARFVMFIERIDRGQTFDRALADAYSTDLRRLEVQWRDEVGKRYSWAPVLLGGGLLWIGMIGLVIAGWVRRRRRQKRILARWKQEEALEDRLRMQLQQRELSAAAAVRVDDQSPVAVTPVMARPPESLVPKVEHDGRWHTVH